MAAEDQGIMSLPMEGEAASQNMPQMPLEESYDAVQQGLQNASPQAAADIQQLMAGITPQLDQLSDEELNTLLQIVQYLYEGGEAEYAKRLQEVIAAGAIDAGDLPEEFDPEVLSSIGTVLLQAIRQRQGGMQAEQGPMPTGQEPMPPAQFARGGIADAARIVASRGRSGDTMLAHINPAEARLLRSHGGMGTINPKTGLPEYGFLSGIGKAIKGVFKGIANAVKSIVKSPIGKVLATVALATFLGPAGVGIASSTFAAPVAAGLVTAAGGGNLKQVLTSAATAYFGAPGGAVSQYVGAAGITNVAANAAVTAGIVGTGAALLSGQKMSDAVKSGLTAGAVGGLTSAVQQQLPSPAPRTDLPPVSNAVAKPVVDGSILTPRTSEIPLAPVPAAVAPGAVDVTGPDFGARSAIGASQMTPQQIEAAMVQQPAGAETTRGMVSPATPPAAAPFARAPGAMESLTRTAGGIGDLFQGKPGAFDTIKQGASDLFMPKTYTAAELMESPVYKNAIEAKMPAAEALKQAQAAYNPSIVREYGPMVAGGIGLAGMMGGFSPSKLPPSALGNQMRGTPGLDLINRNPSQYMIQGLPGVQYSPEGNIIGSSAWSPTATMSDVQVATPNYTSGIFGFNPASRYPGQYFAAGGVASLASGGYPRKTGAISGPGTETSDSIPAMLSDGEFVMTAKAVKGIGGGSRRAGAKKMYALMHQLERNASRG